MHIAGGIRVLWTHIYFMYYGIKSFLYFKQTFMNFNAY